MRFANTLPLVAAALVAGASRALANDFADYDSTFYAREDDTSAVGPSAHHGFLETAERFVGPYDFFKLLNYPGAREHAHAHADAHVVTDATVVPSADSTTGTGEVDASASGDASQPQERGFEDDLEELDARKNHKKKKHHGRKKKHDHKHKKQNHHHGKKKQHHHGKKKHHHDKKKHHHDKKKHHHNKKKHHDKKKHHHKRAEEELEVVVRAYQAGEIDARMFDQLVERYNVVGDSYLSTRKFIDIADLETRELGILLWD